MDRAVPSWCSAHCGFGCIYSSAESSSLLHWPCPFSRKQNFVTPGSDHRYPSLPRYCPVSKTTSEGFVWPGQPRIRPESDSQPPTFMCLFLSFYRLFYRILYIILILAYKSGPHFPWVLPISEVSVLSVTTNRSLCNLKKPIFRPFLCLLSKAVFPNFL